MLILTDIYCHFQLHAAPYRHLLSFFSILSEQTKHALSFETCCMLPSLIETHTFVVSLSIAITLSSLLIGSTCDRSIYLCTVPVTAAARFIPLHLLAPAAPCTVVTATIAAAATVIFNDACAPTNSNAFVLLVAFAAASTCAQQTVPGCIAPRELRTFRRSAHAGTSVSSAAAAASPEE